jgi:hypothetical protein
MGIRYWSTAVRRTASAWPMSRLGLRRYAAVARRAPGGPKPEPGADARPAAPPGAALIISKWAGHYDSAFTQKTYVHASEEDLQRGQPALARIHKIA